MASDGGQKQKWGGAGGANCAKIYKNTIVMKCWAQLLCSIQILYSCIFWKIRKTNKDIAKKQMAIVDKFRKVANFVAIDTKQAEKKTTKQIADMNKEKYKIDDVVDERPSSASTSASSLF